MPTKLNGLWRLFRFKDYAGSVVFTTCIGATAGADGIGVFDWRIVLLLVANWLAVGFAFAFNDVEDAPDDALTPHKAARNPITAGLLTVREGNLASLAMAVIAMLLYVPLGLWPTVCGAVCLLFGYLYSWRPMRLKSVPVIDVVSHSWMLAGLQFLAAYFSYTQMLNHLWVAPLISLVSASSYGQLYNEVRDFEGDIKAGVRHTASVLGRSVTHKLMMVLVTVAVVAGLYSLFIDHLMPTWVILISAALVATVALPGIVRGWRNGSSLDANEPVIEAVPYIGTAVMLAWFVGPWALAMMMR